MGTSNPEMGTNNSMICGPEGTCDPEMGTHDPSGRHVGYDFGLQSGKGQLYDGETTIEVAPKDIPAHLKPGDCLYIEASFGSYGTNEDFNTLLFNLVGMTGSTRMKISNRAAKNFKTENGIEHKDKNKPDDEQHELDAKIIREIGMTQPERVQNFRFRSGIGKAKSPQHAASDRVRAELHKFLNEERFTYGKLPTKNGKKTKKNAVGWYNARLWLAKNGLADNAANCSSWGVAAFLVKVYPEASRKAYDKLRGMFEHAYPSMPRGHTMQYLPKTMKGKGTKGVRKAGLQEIRKTGRHIFAKVKGTFDPEMGTIDPLTKLQGATNAAT